MRPNDAIFMLDIGMVRLKTLTFEFGILIAVALLL